MSEELKEAIQEATTETVEAAQAVSADAEALHTQRHGELLTQLNTLTGSVSALSEQLTYLAGLVMEAELIEEDEPKEDVEEEEKEEKEEKEEEKIEAPAAREESRVEKRERRHRLI